MLGQGLILGLLIFAPQLRTGRCERWRCGAFGGRGHGATVWFRVALLVEDVGDEGTSLE